MSLKLFGFIILLSCVVHLESTGDIKAGPKKFITLKEAENQKRQLESTIDDSVNNSDILPLVTDNSPGNETTITTQSYLSTDDSTKVALNETEKYTNATENPIEVSTSFEIGNTSIPVTTTLPSGTSTDSVIETENPSSSNGTEHSVTEIPPGTTTSTINGTETASSDEPSVTESPSGTSTGAINGTETVSSDEPSVTESPSGTSTGAINGTETASSEEPSVTESPSGTSTGAINGTETASSEEPSPTEIPSEISTDAINATETVSSKEPSVTETPHEALTDLIIGTESPSSERETEATEALINSTSTLPEIESTSPEPETTTIDPKYRNETFELYLKDFLRQNPSAILYTSPGFPVPYDGNLHQSLSVTLHNCTGIDVIVHYLDLNPFLPDTLQIRGGDLNSTSERGRKLTGRETKIQKFKILHTTKLFISFITAPRRFSDTEYKGFVLTYSPYGNATPPITTTEPPVTIPPSELETIEVQLVLPLKKFTNGTLNTILKRFKEVLANSASDYVLSNNLHVEPAHPENVTIVGVSACPTEWPNYENCMRLEFAIPLWNLDYDPEVDFDLSIFDYELSSNSLAEMWENFGRNRFAKDLGIEEYLIPDGTYILLLWTGISLAIIFIFMAVLYGIWRIDIFREYRRMYNKSDDHQDILKVKSELDLSMYPIPHQPYPTLFETNEVVSAGYYDFNENVPTSFDQSNFQHDVHAPATQTNSPLFPDDEETFGRVPSMSPRSKQKLLLLGAKREESIT